ncbi:MAG: hypothetical protein WCG02_02145 [Candidatus Taylorbacteria bacterium]
MQILNKNQKLSELCEMLFDAKFNVYELENKKWWGRKNKTANSSEIDKWDQVSRAWNEKRSVIKKEIDEFFKQKFDDGSKKEIDIEEKLLFSVLPISLMIDMMTIEKIKMFDLRNKKNSEGLKKAEKKLKALKKLIDSSVIKIAQEKNYIITQEARTF